MQSCSSKSSIVKSDRFSKGQCPENDIERDQMKEIPYLDVCSSSTRPDIAFVVDVLDKYLSDPSQSHWKAANKVLRHLQGTKDLMFKNRRIDALKVVGFSDSDYASCVDDKKSTSCYIFMMAERDVLWKSVKKTFITSSTMDAEYVACYEATCHTIWLRNFILALEVVHSIFRLLQLFYDNSIAASFSRNTRALLALSTLM